MQRNSVINVCVCRNAPMIVTAGSKHVAVIDMQAQLHVWGDGVDGQLGIDARMLNSVRPHLV